ncbi:MAG: HEAT repeat domain-containing protein [Candidatus Muirbacterium halophilum]|nr:HEAT repeat domain-containing protein [Candidatus Muirbacterium halophilum]
MQMYVDMLNEQDDNVKLYALRKLVENGVGVDCIEFLEKNIVNFSDEVKSKVIDILNSNKSEFINKYALANIFSENSQEVICNLLISLTIEKSDESFRIIKSFLHNESNIIRAKAVEAMFESGFKNIIEHILPMTKDNDPLVRINAYYVLFEKSGEEFFDNIVEESKSKDENVRAYVALILSKLLCKRKFSVIQELLKDVSPIVRKNAVISMRKERNITYMKYFVDTFITEKNKEVLEEIVYSMKELDKDKSVLMLERVMVDNKSKTLLKNFLWALGKLRNEKALIILKKNLLDSDEEIRACSIDSLGEFNNRKLVDVMLPYLNDRSEEVKLSAAKVLWKFGVMNAYSSLKKMLGSGSDSIKRKASIILALMGI